MQAASATTVENALHAKTCTSLEVVHGCKKQCCITRRWTDKDKWENNNNIMHSI